MRKTNIDTSDVEVQEALEEAAQNEYFNLLISLEKEMRDEYCETEPRDEFGSLTRPATERLVRLKKWLTEGETKCLPETYDTPSSEPLDMKGMHRMDWWQLYMDMAEPRNSAEIAVAGVLLRHFNSNTGEAFPSVNTIAAEAKCRKGAAQEAINRMRELGFVKTKPGKRNSETYQMSLPPDLANVVLLEYERRQREQRVTYSEQRRHG